jgi:hypothetical protein
MVSSQAAIPRSCGAEDAGSVCSAHCTKGGWCDEWLPLFAYAKSLSIYEASDGTGNRLNVGQSQNLA